MRTIAGYFLISMGLCFCGYAMAQEGLKTDTLHLGGTCPVTCESVITNFDASLKTPTMHIDPVKGE